MNRIRIEEIILSGLALLFAGVSPNLFPAAQAGYAKMSILAVWVLIPAVVLLGITLGAAWLRGHQRLARRILIGAAAGLIATVGLEAVRITSFRVFRGMPGDMPQLLGVLLLDRFMLGPSALSTSAGYFYHFWNGASFGIIYAVVLGRRAFPWAIGYGLLIGTGFLLSPAVKALGVGFMAINMPSMIVTVALAHLVFGAILGLLCHRWLRDADWVLSNGFGRRIVPR